MYTLGATSRGRNGPVFIGSVKNFFTQRLMSHQAVALTIDEVMKFLWVIEMRGHHPWQPQSRRPLGNHQSAIETDHDVLHKSRGRLTGVHQFSTQSTSTDDPHRGLGCKVKFGRLGP